MQNPDQSREFKVIGGEENNRWFAYLPTLLTILGIGLVVAGLWGGISAINRNFDQRIIDRKTRAATAEQEHGLIKVSEHPYSIYKMDVEGGYLFLSANAYGSWGVFVPEKENED